jgi:sulfhydrogenase subunit alpha
LPDFFDITNDIKFINKYKKETECAIRVRQWALKVIETIGGRAVHPIACEVGGFKAFPSKEELKELLSEYEAVLKDALCLVNMVFKAKLPKLKRPTTFIALTNESEYAYYHGHIKILYPDGKTKIISDDKFTKHVKEIEEPYRAAKSAELDGEPFMVGALARININHAQLNPLAAGILKSLKWKYPNYNIFDNITAQTIEVVHFIEESKNILIDLSLSLKEEKSAAAALNLIAAANPRGRETFGADAVEAPRGTLYHHYKVSADGYLREVKIITPTVSFLKNLEADIAAYLPNIKDLPEKKRSLKIRALIRAYDPCISCATH